eukprot:313162-Chlamydomonas_euryale.AAC.2
MLVQCASTSAWRLSYALLHTPTLFDWLKLQPRTQFDNVTPKHFTAASAHNSHPHASLAPCAVPRGRFTGA